jgi:hypothetical protein
MPIQYILWYSGMRKPCRNHIGKKSGAALEAALSWWATRIACWLADLGCKVALHIGLLVVGHPGSQVAAGSVAGLLGLRLGELAGVEDVRVAVVVRRVVVALRRCKERGRRRRVSEGAG